jgi:hypothetical protein
MSVPLTPNDENRRGGTFRAAATMMEWHRKTAEAIDGVGGKAEPD